MPSTASSTIPPEGPISAVTSRIPLGECVIEFAPAFSIWLRGPETTDSFCFRLSRSEVAASRIDSAMNGTGFWNDDARQIHRLSAVSTEKQGQSGLGIEARRRVIEDYLNGGRWELLAEYSRSRDRKSTRLNSSH